MKRERKQCHTCKVDKPVNMFWKNRSTKAGLMSSCIACEKKKYADRKDKNVFEGLLDSPINRYLMGKYDAKPSQE